MIHIDDQITGIVRDEPMERTFFGTVLEHRRRWQSSDTVTDDLRIGNQIAIVANDEAYKYASAISYCEFMGECWTVTDIKIRRPKIILTLGGVYHGKRSTGATGGIADARPQGLL